MTKRDQEISELTHFLTYRFSRVQAKMNSQATYILRSQGSLSLVQWRILSILAHSGPKSARQITQDLTIDKGQLSRKVGQLVKDGLVKSKANRSDSRSNMLSLTAFGRREFEKILPIMRQRQAYLLSRLSVLERNSIFKILEKLEMATDKKDFEGEE